MGYKLKGDIQDYIDQLTPEMIKDAFEEYGFEIELKEEYLAKKGK
jgi:hypothetical protein